MTQLVRLPTLFPKRMPPPRPKLRPVPWPYAAEVAYAQELLAVAKGAQQGLRATVPKLSKLVTKTKVPRTDDLGESLARLINELRAEFEIPTREARKMALKMLKLVDFSQMRGMEDQLAEIVSLNFGDEVWLDEAMEMATTENVALIKSIPSTMFDRVQKHVGDAVMTGMRPEMLAGLLFEEFDVSENRALLIATDQVGSWFGSLQRYRQIEVGFTHFAWSSSNDSRVRASHRAREGRIYAWSDPPDGEIPGKPIRCRCVAVPHWNFEDDPFEEAGEK